MEKTERDQQLLANATPAEEKTTEILPCDLTVDEQVERGQQLVQAMAEKAKLIADKKTIANEFKQRELEAETKIGMIQKVVSERREYRDIECTEFRDYKAGKVFVVRDDLGTIVHTRQMTQYERQQLLPEVSAEETPTANNGEPDQHGQDKKTSGERGKARAARASSAPATPTA